MSKEGKKLSIKIGYRDSRRAAARILQPGKRFALRRALLFVAVTLTAVAIWNTVTVSLPPEQRAVLLLFLVAVGLWVTEAVPAFAVGLLIMGYLVFALGTPLIMPEPWDVNPYLNTWSSPVIWLMLGGFFMAEGLSRTGLDRQLFAFAIKPAGTRPGSCTAGHHVDQCRGIHVYLQYLHRGSDDRSGLTTGASDGKRGAILKGPAYRDTGGRLGGWHGDNYR